MIIDSKWLKLYGTAKLFIVQLPGKLMTMNADFERWPGYTGPMLDSYFHSVHFAALLCWF